MTELSSIKRATLSATLSRALTKRSRMTEVASLAAKPTQAKALVTEAHFDDSSRRACGNAETPAFLESRENESAALPCKPLAEFLGIQPSSVSGTAEFPSSRQSARPDFLY
jgi:hypothetical protein